MSINQKAHFTTDAGAKTITVTKEIAAPVDVVWTAWTTAGQLDKWWGPEPWKAVTKNMDFTEGGSWVYKMQGPNGEEQWDKVIFTGIDAPRQFSATDLFTDEKGNKKADMPSTQWKNSFTKTSNGTRIVAELSFDTAANMNTILNTGFEKGFSKGLDQLEELLGK
ncbi:MAG: SRPBCC domain-containing protein [Chitinophagaceae bacterium]